jgi:hypothetical protein
MSQNDFVHLGLGGGRKTGDRDTEVSEPAPDLLDEPDVLTPM